MKKSLFAMVAAGAVTLASCSSDEMVQPVVGDGNVIITAQLPTALQGRYGEGNVAKKLEYAVYEGDNVIFASDEPGSPAPKTVDSKNFILSLNLVKGKTYDLVFWADAAEESPYTFTSSSKSVTVTYDNAGNNENRDAFFQAVKNLTVTGPVQQTVQLRRPFAQINVGTSDLADFRAAKNDVATTTMTVSGVYDTLNLFTGEASGSAEITAEYTAAIPEDQSFPVDATKYDYLAMNYILTGSIVSDPADVQNADRELIDIAYKVTCDDGHEIDYSFTNVPVQRNYRTNIYGALLTNPANFNIVVIPGFNDPDNDYEVLEKWDGVTKNPVELKEMTIGDKTVKVASVNYPAEWAWLVDKINSADAGDYAYATIILEKDLDLNGNTIAPLGEQLTNGFGGEEGVQFGVKQFSGSIDGQNHTIMNAVVKVSHDGAGLIGQVRGSDSSVKNLHAENITFDFSLSPRTVKWTGGLIGYLEGGTDGKIVVENCSVKNITIDNGVKSLYTAGALIGYISSTGVDIKNCAVDNVSIKGDDTDHCSTAGIVGKIYQARNINIENCSVKGLETIYADELENISLDKGCANGLYIGSIFNYGNGADLNINISGCSFSDWTDTALKDNDRNLANETFASNPLYPFIGGFDSYFTNPGSKITMDGNQLFPLTVPPAGKVKIGNALYQNLAGAFSKVADGDVVELAASDYDVEGLTWPQDKTFSIKGQGKGISSLSNLTKPTGANGNTMTFEDLTLNVEENPTTATCFGFIHTVDVTYNNVHVNGELHLYATGTETFNNCDFTYNAASDPKNGGRYAVWCYGSRNAVFNNCTFENDFNAKAILVYGDETHYNRNVTVKNCKFTAAATKDNGAVEIHTETFNGACAGTIIIENSTCDDTYEMGLWHEVNNSSKETTTTFKVIVDNVTVQEGISVDPQPQP